MSIENIKKALEKVYIGEWYVSGVKTNGLSVVHNAADSSMFGITAETFEAEYIVAVNPAVISELLSIIEILPRDNAVLKQDRSPPVTGDLIERLRAKKPHMSYGLDRVEQQWPASDLEIEAAAAIERLEAVVLEQAKGMLRQLEACEAYRARAETAEDRLLAFGSHRPTPTK